MKKRNLMKTIPIMKTKSIMKYIKLALLALLAGATVTSCDMQPPGAETTGDAAGPKAIPVKVMELSVEPITVTQTVTSTVVAYEETYLSPALSGRIRSVKVDVNDRVRKGQLLVEMDRTQLDQTTLQFQQLNTDLARMDTLLRYGSVTQQAYDQMKAQVETTELILQNLEENTLLRAPYAGVITGKYYNDGELYSPAPNTPAGKAALISMIQIDPVKVLVNLSETYLPLVKDGMTAIVTTDVYPDLTFTGKIFRIHPTVSAASRTFAAEVRVPNSQGKLAPGMFARVSLELGETEGLMVPAISVLQQSGTNQRYIMLNENGSARKVNVSIIKRYDDQLQISSPDLHGGEQLIYAGQARLEEGTPVNVVAD
jgi:membrane fusion protein (multidrug efflux system)